MNFLKVTTSVENVSYSFRVFIPCKLFLLDLGEVNLHIVMSYMTSNISSSIVVESLLSVLDRLLFFMVWLLST